MPVLCLDLSDKSLEYIELQRKTGLFPSGRFGSYALEEGIIEKGEIKQEKAHKL